jgi:hypothetical protein
MREQPLRLKGNLNRRRPIRLRAGRQEWSLPSFVLNGRRNTQVAAYPPIQLYGAIIHCFSTRYEVAVYVCVPVPELKCVSRAKPVLGPGLESLTVSANPVSDDVFVVGVQVVVEELPVDILTTPTADAWVAGWGVCVHRLESKIQFG